MSRTPISSQLATLTKTKKKRKVVVKVGMVGDSQIGKTSLMVKYVEGNFNEDYIQTLGVNFMEKTISLRNTDITFSIWDLGGQQEYLHMLPLVCNDAVALLFMFDLSRKHTLTAIKDWYKQARLLNKQAIPFLIGTKYDYFANMKNEEKIEITTQARRFAKAMKAPLIFCSASHSINVHKIFKVVLSKVFDLKCNVEQITTIGDPIIEYEIGAAGGGDASAGGDKTAKDSTNSNASDAGNGDKKSEKSSKDESGADGNDDSDGAKAIGKLKLSEAVSDADGADNDDQ